MDESDLSFCMNGNCTVAKSSTIDVLVKKWGYTDILPENVHIFQPLPYHVHLFIGAIFTILGVMGTSISLSILHAHKKLARYLLDPSGILVVNLMVANLGVVLFQVPFSAISSFFGRWVFGETGCQIYAGVGFVLGIGSILAFFLISLELYWITNKNRFSMDFFQMDEKSRGFYNLKLICLQWILAIILTVPPMLQTLGRMHLEPSGTMCTIDYWHGNFKHYRVYMILLISVGFTGPLLASLIMFTKSTGVLKAQDAFATNLTAVELKYILGLARFCALGYGIILLAWGPFVLLCTYTLFASAEDINIFLTAVPPIMAKFAPLLMGLAAILCQPRIFEAFQWIREHSKPNSIPEEVISRPKPLWT